MRKFFWILGILALGACCFTCGSEYDYQAWENAQVRANCPPEMNYTEEYGIAYCDVSNPLPLNSYVGHDKSVLDKLK